MEAIKSFAPFAIYSICGAALVLEDPGLRVPDQFNLQLTEDRLTLPCSIVWRRGFWVGVRFLDLS